MMKLKGLICSAYGLPSLSAASGFITFGLLTVIRPTATRFSKRGAFAGRLNDRRTIESHAWAIQAAVVALGIGRIKQMAQAMLGVAIFLVIDALAQQGRFAAPIANKEGIALGGNRQAPQLPLLFGLRVEVVILDLKDRARDRGAIVGIERLEALCDRIDLRPR